MDQAYKVAYNEALEAAKANNLDEAYTKFGEAAELAGQAGEDAIAQRASQVRAQIDYNRGALAAKNENYEQALTYFNQGIENDPQYAKNYLGKASALRKQENINEAMAALPAGHRGRRAERPPDRPGRPELDPRLLHPPRLAGAEPGRREPSAPPTPRRPSATSMRWSSTWRPTPTPTSTAPPPPTRWATTSRRSSTPTRRSPCTTAAARTRPSCTSPRARR